MFLRELTDPLDSLNRIGKETAQKLQSLGISNLGELLGYFPRDWQDRSVKVPLGDFSRRPEICSIVKVIAQGSFFLGSRRIPKVFIEDSSARAVLVCYNPFDAKNLIPGESYWLWGRFSYQYGELQSTAFDYEKLKGDPPRYFDRALPLYPRAGGMQKTLVNAVQDALEKRGEDIEDELPDELIARKSLLHKSQAIRAIHFPKSPEELAAARRTLIYEELFYLEITIGKRALERRSGPVRGSLPYPALLDGLSPLQNRLLERLPFKLTDGQRKVLEEINRDMESPYPMARLIQGDVGSGKTLVSFLASLRAIEKGGQAALMAPTELLARQHAENAAILLEPLGIRPAFLTGNLKSAGRRALLQALASGGIDFAVGTHALFSRDVIYKNLQLVTVDEQHRFGVLQRQAIMAKGNRPDLLMMSATPIPRTLALTIFGDLDVSVIPDLPPGRKPIKTHLARMGREERVYQFVRRELEAGRQAYFVYPLIENPEEGGLASSIKDAESMAAKLREEIFPGMSVALIHSRLDEEEKRRIMKSFRQGEVRILAATSVVEVGVDVPNATCMVIEHAERFGLAALHQLRGRVGRGPHQSYCFLVFFEPNEEQKLSEEGKAKLTAMQANADGFIIAEEDLKIRGPGRFTGIEQSGYLKLQVADPIRDAEILAEARVDAFGILERDEKLQSEEFRRIAEVLERSPPFSQIIL